MPDRWLWAKELSVYLQIERDTVFKWITRKGLLAHNAGRLWRFKARDVDVWL